MESIGSKGFWKWNQTCIFCLIEVNKVLCRRYAGRLWIEPLYEAVQSAGIVYRYGGFADMAELADAPDLGSGGQPCRFESCYPHVAKAAII